MEGVFEKGGPLTGVDKGAPMAVEAPSIWNGRWRHIVLQLLGACMIVTAAHYLLPFKQPAADASVYLLLARDLKFEDGFLFRNEPGTSLHFPPGYPWMLSLLVEREDLGLAPGIQRLYHGVTIAVGSIWATTAFGASVGWLVFGLLAANPAFLASSSMLTSEALHAPLYLGGFLAWFRFIQTRKIGSLILCSMLLALSVYVRGYGLLLVAVLPALMFIGLRDWPWQRRLGHVAVFLVIWCLILAPWTIRNYQLFGRFVPMTTTGTTVYSAWFPPGPLQLGMMADDEVTQAAGKITDHFEQDRFLRRSAIEKILAHPGMAIDKTLRSYVFYLMPFDWEFFGTYNASGKLRPSLHFMYIFILPFAGLFIWRHRSVPGFWVGPFAPILFGLVMTAAILGIPRFRLCIEPFLTTFAAVTIVEWVSARPHVRPVIVGSYFLVCVTGAYVFAQLVQ